MINNTESNYPLDIEKLSKRYSRNDFYSIKDVSFKIKKGQFHGFIGSNGAGKTTTIKSIIGAYAKYQGSIKIYGHTNDTINAKKRVGYIPESANFPKELNSYQYLKYMAILSGVNKKKASKIALEKLQELGLEDFKNKKPKNFSSGQKKKILLAQSLIHDPDLIIMDEPAANLDPKARSNFFNTLKELQKKGKSIFISSHILAELENYIDSLTIIDSGQIVFSGNVNETNSYNENKYIIQAKNENEILKIESLLEKHKFKKEKIDQKTISLKILDKKDIFLIYEIILKNKIILSKFLEDKKSLQQIYEQYAIDRPKIFYKKGRKNA